MLSLGSGNSCVYRWGFCTSVCVLGRGGGTKGWHPTHKSVSTQVMAGAYDQIFTSFLYYCSSQAHTHRHTPQPTPFLWILKKGGDGSGKGFRRGLFQLYLRGLERELLLPTRAQVSPLSLRKVLARRGAL